MPPPPFLLPSDALRSRFPFRSPSDSLRLSASNCAHRALAMHHARAIGVRDKTLPVRLRATPLHVIP